MKNLLLSTQISGNAQALNQFERAFEDLIQKILPIVIGIGVTLTVLWAIYIGVKVLTAKKTDQRVESKKLITQFILGLAVIAILTVGAPLLISFLVSWIQGQQAML